MPRFSFGENEAKQAFKAFGWSVASALIALCIALTTEMDFPPEYAFMIPFVNVVLYSLKQFVSDNSNQ